MKRKKIMSLLLGIFVITSAIAATTVATATAKKNELICDASFTMTSSDKVNAGDLTTVSVNLSEEANLGAITFNLLYDTEQLEYVQDSLKASTDIVPMVETNTKNLGKIIYGGISLDPIMKGGTILTVQFKVLKPGCTVKFEAVEIGLGDFDSTDVTEQVVKNSMETVKIECAHRNTEWEITKEASHITDGEKRLVCTGCKETLETAVIPALGHNFDVWSVAKHPTCTEKGLEERICTCGEKESREIDALGHDTGKWTVVLAPACTEKGVQELHCTRCDTLLKTEEIVAAGHSFGEWKTVKEATCTEVGIEERICTVCGEKENREIAALGHDEGKWVVALAPTCTEKGVRELRCTRCDTVLKTEEIAATGHSFGDWKTVKEATCTEVGTEERICTVCGEKENREIAALGHDEGKWIVTLAPTCTEKGTRELRCTRCNTVLKTEEIAANGHSFGEWKTVKEAACTEIGTEERICTVCGEKESREVAALGHDEGKWVVALAPTCTEKGTRELRCTRCDTVLKTEEIAATGHSFGDWKTVKEATCTEVGTEERICTVCGEKESREVAALGHDEGKWIFTSKPTCTQKGLQELHCTRCDMVLDTAEIDVIAHDFGDWVVEKEATALKEGLQYRICNVCNTREEEAIPKLPAEEGTVEETTSAPPTTYDSQTKPTEPTERASDENGKVPPTGDETIILPFAALAALSLGVIFITKKRKTERQS